MAVIIDGKSLAKKIRDGLKDDVAKLKNKGINVPEDIELHKPYIDNVHIKCEKCGKTMNRVRNSDITMDELLSLIDELNARDDIHGILLQSPIPKHLDINKAFNRIDYRKDVDGFNPVNVGKLVIGEDCFISCTPFGVMKMLEEYGIDIEGKNAVVVGRSNIVGKPLAQCLLQKNATVTICHSRTKNIHQITNNADILVAALGKPRYIKDTMVKEGAVVIDVGINRTEDGKLVGDVDFESVSKNASYITPVPGGVGPMTIAMLMTNLVKAAKNWGNMKK